LITSKDNWETTRPLLESLTKERLKTAAQQAAQHDPISDAAVKKLLAMVNTIGTKDPGLEEHKSQLLARLKSAMVYHGLPQIFITLNPADNISPIALFYAGERIDVHHSTRTCTQQGIDVVFAVHLTGNDDVEYV
jgi:ribosomal protein L29